MANKKGRRRFGYIRKLPSGRYQASYLTPDSRRHFAPETFELKGDASQWLVVIEGEMLRGEWIDPSLGRTLFGQYRAQWIEEHRIGARTREEYWSIWRHHVEPFLGSIELAELTTGVIRT